ncbi:hypothetical protein GE300_02985 [Rhodobacteraceae bacterium 2CG4]|uniref:Tetratricopeptide repeat protein n=1 Tax=Halovulum marinum TaxID=2662447 RepID=A0A6L5YW54_9RHOB|nr:hypothetical protein [Halovulum marinum]
MASAVKPDRIPADRDRLDAALLAAHAAGDADALARLYTTAGDWAEAAGDIDAACFYLTHAFVFALESGAPQVGALNERLAARGRAHRMRF